MRVLGIDPGLDASAAMFRPEASVASGDRWQFLDVPRLGGADGDRPDAAKLRDWIRRFNPDTAYVERVFAMPKQGISSTAKFMRAAGYLEATVQCCDVPFHLVTPQMWKGWFEIAKGADKDWSRVLALQCFPELEPLLKLKKHHGRAEAALIAYYGSKMQEPIAA